MHVHGKATDPAAGRVLLRRDVIVQRSIVHEDRNRAERFPRLGDQLLATFFQTDIGDDGDGLAAGFRDILDSPG